MEEQQKPQPVVISIFKAHAERIGWWRAALGGGLMYTTIPLFMFLHVTVTLVLYKILLRPLLGLGHISAKDYIILDRYSLQGLNWFDRFNCLFCEYANGVTTLMNAEIDQAAHSKKERCIIKKLIIGLYLIPQTLLTVIIMLIATIPTNILMKTLGLHRASHKRILKRLREEDYAGHHGRVSRAILRTYKLSADIIAYNLEQIESSWCPIKHLEKEGYVFPAHHNNFCGRDELGEIEQTLRTKGTVSSNLPKF